jgi:hypothetical protein
MLTPRKMFATIPDPRSPAAKHFDYAAIGVPHPDSPQARYFNWSVAGVVHPHAPAARTASPKRPAVRKTVRKDPKFILPDTVEIVCPMNTVAGGGFFWIHHTEYDCSSGERNDRPPDIKVRSNPSTHQFEIESITIYTVKIVRNPSPRALPRAGDNVLNDKSLGIRTPLDDPAGNGYWQLVIRDMERYENQGVNFQWFAPDSTAYHEGWHNKQFRDGMKLNSRELTQKIYAAIKDMLPDPGDFGITEATYIRVAQKAVMQVITHVPSVTGEESEPEAYRETFAARWRPEIEKIRAYAIAHNWD